MDGQGAGLRGLGIPYYPSALDELARCLFCRDKPLCALHRRFSTSPACARPDALAGVDDSARAERALERGAPGVSVLSAALLRLGRAVRAHEAAALCVPGVRAGGRRAPVLPKLRHPQGERVGGEEGKGGPKARAKVAR